METDQGLWLDETGMALEGGKGNCILYIENPVSGNSTVFTGTQAETQDVFVSVQVFCENFPSENCNTSESRH